MTGFTIVPRWTTNPLPGVGTHEVRIPDTLTSSLQLLANEMGVALRSVLLTAHAKVLSALSGDDDVCTGYAVESDPPRPLRLTLGRFSWRDVLLDAVQAEAEIRKNSSIGDVRFREVHSDQLFETTFDMNVGDTECGTEITGGRVADDIVLGVTFIQDDGLSLRLNYSLEILDASVASRIARYHLNALSLLVSDPYAGHTSQSLLSTAELRFQIHGLAGRRRQLPARRVHEIFEEHARMHPGVIAAVCGNREMSYGELNARANRLARAIVSRGLTREQVVAVVTERNLDWMTAVLAIFKSGCAYLPIEPQFPAERIERMLSRAGCRMVLTEHGSTTNLDQALTSLPGVRTLFIDTALAEGYADGDLGITVAPDQLAYIFFTSGSTGEPKGAMVEHAGMLNHIFAKIDDLGVLEGDAVAQTGPQCFDISIWQLVAALLVGGRTMIIDQETILDAERFFDKIVGDKVAVMQVVPSYLEVLTSYLAQHPRQLPDLRCVSATGEALKKELVQRWFAVQPGIKLVNTYGLTETSDDTNHETMEVVPSEERVPLGRPIPNVYVYVVNEQLSPVPLGAPGEIVFSGICVGRGYINDPERTQRAFLQDPHRQGERMYRSGDYGRWLPDGRLEYLGRRDSQVKVSGFRIEIGEVENRLLRLPGIREAALVVTERADHSKQLVAFYSGERSEAALMRDRLGESLPYYMVPSTFHWRQSLPLSGNGKIDKKALTALARELDVPGQDHESPATSTEQWLASAWAQVLGIPTEQIGRRDHFFDLGGTSLSAVKLAITLEHLISFKELTAHPILVDQAELIEQKGKHGVPLSLVTVPAARCAPARRTADRTSMRRIR